MAQYELRYLAAALEELEAYLLADQLFWHLHLPVAGQPAYPQLTTGNLALFRRRLTALERGQVLTRVETSQYQRIERELEAWQSKWRVAWEEKALQEFRSRLRQWALYLEEVERAPEKHGAFYPSEVRLRVLLELLKDQVAVRSPTEFDLLPALDARLRFFFLPGDFIWEKELQPGFPAEQYWFLYGAIDIEKEPR